MGNTIIKDILFNFSQKAVSKEVLLINNINDTSLFELNKGTTTIPDRDIFFNLKGKEKVYNIDFSGQDVVFLDRTSDYNNRYFKDELKKYLTSSIYNIQNNTEFIAFLKDVKISNSVEFINLFNSVIEDHLNIDLIRDNVAFRRIEDSSVFVDFVDASNYFNTYKVYSRKNIQNLYISNVAKLMIEIFLKDERTLYSTKYIENKIINENKKEYEVMILTFVLFAIFILIGFFIYNNVVTGSPFKNMIRNMVPEISIEKINNGIYF